MKNERAVLDRLMPGLDDKLAAQDRAARWKPPTGRAWSCSRLPTGPACSCRATARALARPPSRQWPSRWRSEPGPARSPSRAPCTTSRWRASSPSAPPARPAWRRSSSRRSPRSATCSRPGFAEGRPGAGILSPTMTARPVEGGVVVDGAKKPCSLARSMTMLTASVDVQGQGTRRVGSGRRPGACGHRRGCASSRSGSRRCWPVPRATRSSCTTCSSPNPSSCERRWRRAARSTRPTGSASSGSSCS